MNNELKLILQKIKDQLVEQGIELGETPALFKWSYPDDPMIQYQLLIKLLEEAEAVFEDTDDTVH